MTALDTFIREAVERCFPHASVKQKYNARKRLSKILIDQRDFGTPINPYSKRLLHEYNRVYRTMNAGPP